MKELIYKIAMYVVIGIGAIACLFIKLTFMLAKGVVNAFGSKEEKTAMNEALGSLRDSIDEDEESDSDKFKQFVAWLVCC